MSINSINTSERNQPAERSGERPCERYQGPDEDTSGHDSPIRKKNIKAHYNH